VDVEHLVRLAVSVVARHRLRRADHAEHDVAVEEERNPAGDRVTGRRHILGVDEVVPMRGVGPRFERHVADLLDPVRLGGRRAVVQERRAAAEALDAEQLLGVQRAIGLAELGVALGWHLAAPDVEHGRPF